jgi:hypothetical protein
MFEVLALPTTGGASAPTTHPHISRPYTSGLASTLEDEYSFWLLVIITFFFYFLLNTAQIARKMLDTF